MNARVYLSMRKDQPEVVSVSEVAKILRIGKNKAYALVKNGSLSLIKVGGKNETNHRLMEILSRYNQSDLYLPDSLSHAEREKRKAKRLPLLRRHASSAIFSGQSIFITYLMTLLDDKFPCSVR